MEDFITTNGVSSLEDPRYSPELTAAQQLTDLHEPPDLPKFADTNWIVAAEIGRNTFDDEDDLRVAETDPSVLVHLQTVEAAKRDLSFLRLQYLDPSSPIIQRSAQQLNAAEAALEIRREEVVLRNRGQIFDCR